MTGPEVALSAPLTAAVISGGVALAVALLGICGAVAAQLVATRRAYANSLALFERQHAKQETSRKQERDEEIRREDAHRFAEQRRGTYARFLQLADQMRRASANSTGYLDIVERHESEQGGDEDRRWIYERAEREFRAHSERGQLAGDQLRELVAEVDLLGSADVRAAAQELRLAAEEYVGHPFRPARDAFVDATRRELGIDPFPSSAT